MRVRFIWWNAQDFAHYVPERVGEAQWPESQAEFDAKFSLVAAVLRDEVTTQPVVVALAETTRAAAERLRDQLLPGYLVLSLDLFPKPELQVAVIYPNDAAFHEQAPFAAAFVPRGTRPMAVLDIVQNGHRTRVIACHWTARFRDSSHKTRSILARDLSRYVYEYFESSPTNEQRHLIIVGDLNEEPFGLLESDLYAQRERSRAARTHWTDKDVKRRYLYNASWRMIGERDAVPSKTQQSAGTYYWDAESEWRTFDHLIVDGSLVSGAWPRIDEGVTGVLVHPELFRAGRVPLKFWWNGTAATGGVSDHLPITSTLDLAANDK